MKSENRGFVVVVFSPQTTVHRVLAALKKGTDRCGGFFGGGGGVCVRVCVCGGGGGES